MSNKLIRSPQLERQIPQGSNSLSEDLLNSTSNQYHNNHYPLLNSETLYTTLYQSTRKRETRTNIDYPMAFSDRSVVLSQNTVILQPTTVLYLFKIMIMQFQDLLHKHPLHWPIHCQMKNGLWNVCFFLKLLNDRAIPLSSLKK